MILLGYSLLDNKTGHFSTPFFFNHRGHAIRACIEIGSQPDTTVGRHPADFTLCEVGVFDDQTGRFTTEDVVYLGTVKSFLPNLPPNQGLFGMTDRGGTGVSDLSIVPGQKEPV